MKNYIKIKMFYHLLLLIVIVFSSSCSSDYKEASLIDANYENQNTNVNSNSLLPVAQKIPSIVDFISKVKAQNVSLTDDELLQITRLTRVIPTGEWTPGPENNSQENLKKHFLKHGSDFRPPIKNIQDYLAIAIRAVKNPNIECRYYLDLGPYKEEKIVSVVKWNSKTGEFTVTRMNGQIATYFYFKKLRPDRYINIPDEMR